MFTGIVGGLGTVRLSRPGTVVIDLPASMQRTLVLGGSVAVNGVCLTARRVEDAAFEADLSKETAQRTTLGGLRPGAHVNLEYPMTPEAGLDGHWVLGHVDAVGRIAALFRDGPGWTLLVEYPTQHRRYVVEKGSIAVEGISLTPYDLDGRSLRCAIVPETYESTVLKERRPGDPVNLEFDILAKYVERMMRFVHSD